MIYEDFDSNGILDVDSGRKLVDDQGLEDMNVTLWRNEQGVDFRVASMLTDSNGRYSFNDLVPGVFYIEVDIGDYRVGPIVPGGNQLQQDGRTQLKQVGSGETLVLDGALFMPSASFSTQPDVSHLFVLLSLRSPLPFLMSLSTP